MRNPWLTLAVMVAAAAGGCRRGEPEGVARPGGGGAVVTPVGGDAGRGDGVRAVVDDASGGRGVRLPPVAAGLDYQLGGAYPPPAGVGIVVRDRLAAPAQGLYGVCYVNGFQVQPGEAAWWQQEHPALILKDERGAPVVDEDWDELLLDVSTPDRRSAIAAIVGEWLRGCKAAGFDAVELDNLDSYTRSRGRLTEADAIAMMRLFADRAHAEGLAVAQKNAAELAGRARELGTDFAIAEECNRYDECDTYTRAYGDHVLVVEYRRQDFTAGCARWGDRLSLVLRDRDLVPAEQAGHVFDRC